MSHSHAQSRLFSPFSDRKELSLIGIEVDDSAPLADLIKGMGLDVAQGTEAYNILRQQYALASPAFAREILRFNQQQTDFNFAPASAIVLPTSTAASVSAITLHSIAAKFVEMYVQDKRWDYNTHQEKLAHLATLEEVVGENFKPSNEELDLIAAMQKDLDYSMSVPNQKRG